MAEQSGKSRSGSSRKRSTTAKSGKAPAPGSAASAGSTPASSATTSEPPEGANVLGLEQQPWTPPEGPTPAEAELELDPYEAPAPELIEWTPERAGAIVRAGGFLLHTADGLSREPEGSELWRATEADVDAIGPPLARILNRYEPARRLAGVSDEVELGIGVMGYVRRNLAERGRVVALKRERDEQVAAAAAPLAGPESWPEAEPPA